MDFKMMRFGPVLLALIVLFFLGGCASDIASNLVKLPTGEIVSAATDRFGSWERVEIARAGATQKIIDLEIAELNKKAIEPSVIITIDSTEAMESYERTKTVEALAQSNLALKEVAVALARDGKGKYDGLVVSTPFPKGAFAEFTDSITGLARTPAVGIAAGGYAAGQFFSGMQSGNKINSGGGEVTLNTNDVRVGDENSDTGISDVGDSDEDNSSVEETQVVE